MARMRKEVADKKKRDGKRMFIRGYSLNEIAEVTEVYIDTIKKWAKEDDWQTAKDVHSISIGELKEQVLQTFIDLKEGKTPKLSPDKLSKISAAFQSLSDKKKNVTYMYDNYEILSDALIDSAVEAKTKKEREYRLEIAKYVRGVMDNVVSETYKEALND